MRARWTLGAVAATMVVVGCESPEHLREQAREEQADVTAAQAEKQREIEEARREGAADVREERNEAVDAWADAFRADIQEALTLTRKFDRRLSALELQIQRLEEGQGSTKTDGQPDAAGAYRKRLEELQVLNDKLFQAPADARKPLAERLETSLKTLEDDIVEARAKQRVGAGT